MSEPVNTPAPAATSATPATPSRSSTPSTPSPPSTSSASSRRRARGQLYRELVVDPVVHVDELARFWAKVVRGPGARDCWLWVGAIADDGYGRFWVRRDGRGRVVRPHRYAVAAVHGIALGVHDVAEHVVCDNPICVRAELDPATGHVWPSTQAANLARMGQRARGGGAWWHWRWSPTDRASLAARSRAQRDAVRDGWDPERLRAALDGTAPGDRLF